MDIFFGFVTDTKPLSDAERLVKKVGLETQKTSTQVTNLGKNMRLTKGPTSALSTTAGQLGVQFQDVAVQAQMGTDAVRIFSQQGPQIASIFGPKGAVIGALLAIGAVVVTTVIEAFSQGEESIKSFGDSAKLVNDSVNQLADDSYGLAQSIVDLSQKSDAAARLQIAIALEAADMAARRAREAFERLGLEGQGMYRSIEGADQVTRNFAVALENIKRDGEISATTMTLLNSVSDQLGVSISDVTSLVQEFAKASDPKADSATLVAFGETLAGLAEKADLGNTGFKEYIFNLVDMALKAQTTEERASLLSQAMEDLSVAVGKSDDKAVQFVLRMERMAKEAGKTREEILKLQAAQIDDPALRARAEAAIKIIEDQRKAEEKAEADRKKAAEDEAFRKRVINLGVQKTIQLQKEQERERKRADADAQKAQEKLRSAQKALNDAFGKDQEQARRELVAAGLLEEERLQDLSYQRQLEKLKLWLAQKRITEEEFATSKKELDEKTQESAIKSAADGLQALGQYNKTAFEAYKAYASGKAVMDTYAGATKALAEIPLPWSIAAAAGIVAMGLANVATIQSQQFQGRALGGQVRGGQTYVVGERGPELLTMGGNGTVTPNEKLRGATGTQSVSETVNINFQITANDAAGFDQLLSSRRGMIVSMIGQAMNNRGRRALV